MHIIGYLYEDYHDARPLEHKARQKMFAVARNPHLIYRSSSPQPIYFTD
jgi:hypothetical protein